MTEQLKKDNTNSVNELNIIPLSHRGESILNHLRGINFIIHPNYVLDVFSYEAILDELDRIIKDAGKMKKTFHRGYDMCD